MLSSTVRIQALEKWNEYCINIQTQICSGKLPHWQQSWAPQSVCLQWHHVNVLVWREEIHQRPKKQWTPQLLWPKPKQSQITNKLAADGFCSVQQIILSVHSYHCCVQPLCGWRGKQATDNARVYNNICTTWSVQGQCVITRCVCKCHNTGGGGDLLHYSSAASNQDFSSYTVQLKKKRLKAPTYEYVQHKRLNTEHRRRRFLPDVSVE